MIYRNFEYIKKLVLMDMNQYDALHLKPGKPQVHNLMVCLLKKKRISQVVNYKGRAEVNKMKINGEFKKKSKD